MARSGPRRGSTGFPKGVSLTRIPERSLMPAPQDDPVLISARREALVVGGLWLVTMLYSVLYCYTFGYHRDIATLKLIWGIPDWVFWGIVLPWVGCVLFSLAFGAFFMRDEALGDDTDSDYEDGLLE